MLVITVLSLISTQLSDGIIWESKFIVRSGYFLFTIIAVRASSLSGLGKSMGYTMASAIFLVAIAMIWLETSFLILLYTLIKYM